MDTVINYPPAHLLSLPLELREYIYDNLVTPTQLWQKQTPLRISADCPPPLALLLAHRKLYHEALHHFYRRAEIILHVDAFDAVKSYEGQSIFHDALISSPHIQGVQKLELQGKMNAGVEFLKHDIEDAISVLLHRATDLKIVTVGWAESPLMFMGSWRPWQYKAPALEPVKRLVARGIKVEAGEVKVPPPKTREQEQAGLEKTVRRLVEAVEAENEV